MVYGSLHYRKKIKAIQVGFIIHSPRSLQGAKTPENIYLFGSFSWMATVFYSYEVLWRREDGSISVELVHVPWDGGRDT